MYRQGGFGRMGCALFMAVTFGLTFVLAIVIGVVAVIEQTILAVARLFS